MRRQRYIKLLAGLASGIWRDLTRPAWLKMWEQFAAETGGDLQPPGLWQRGRIWLEHRGLLLELTNVSEESSSFTRLRTRATSDSDFRFSIAKAGILSKLGDAVGLPRFVSGYRELDDEFRISGNSDSHLTMLVGTPAVRELIVQQPDVQVEFRPSLLMQSFRLSGEARDGTSVLQVDTRETVTDLVALMRLVELQKQVLNVLLDLGLVQCPLASDRPRQ